MSDEPENLRMLGRELDARIKASKARRERRERNGNHVGPDGVLYGDVLPPELRSYPLTEEGIARAFAQQHGDDLRYCHGSQRWHVWDGSRWKREQTRLAFHWVHELVRRLGASADTEQLRTMLGKAAFYGGVERIAQSLRAFAITPDQWDRDPWLFNTPGGTVDLRTGELLPPSRGDLITKQAAVTPVEPGTDCPTWRKFLDEVTGKDRDLARFIQQMCGYALTGDVREECLFFLFGVGSNGKSTLLGAMMQIAGDYAMASDMATFTLGKYDRHPTEIAKLAGARMITATETEPGRSWAWSRIKELTGRECKISARFMRQDFFEFVFTGKLIFAGNHKPRLPTNDEATRRRLNVLPFSVTVEPDNTLKERLQVEFPAILRWAIDGCLDWQANGLLRPACVSVATDEYLDEQDTFAAWIDDCCETGPSKHDRVPVLWGSWSQFARDRGEDPGNGGDFAERLRAIPGVRSARHLPNNHAARGYLGIAVTRPTP